MKSETTLISPALPLARSRLMDFVVLTKPRVAFLVLFTVAVGGLLASGGRPEISLLLHTLIGTALVAGSASALNQLLERHSDALMRRTENRPLPSGRLFPLEVLVFGFALGVGGLAYLALLVRQPLTVLVAAFTLVSYVFLYTPLKRKTIWNTLVGAVPGALPPVIGWTAFSPTLGWEPAGLFLVLFLWQVPHFLAIAWIYREDYARAGFRMLPVLDERGLWTARTMVVYCLALIPVSLIPLCWQERGLFYAVGACLLGLGFLTSALAFCREKSTLQARRVLHASLVYLPLLLALLLMQNLSGPVVLAWTR